MKPVAFGYHRPETVSEATALLGQLGPDAAVLSGGMTLGPMLNLRMVRPRVVVDISRIKSLKDITLSSSAVITGAGVVQSDALKSDLVAREIPLLAMALPWVGHFQTRNRGTLGGSVAHADPSAEIPLCLVTCRGAVLLRSKKSERRVWAHEFFQGALITQRRSDELIVALEWPRTPPASGCAFIEIAQRHGDFAIVAVACILRPTPDGHVQDLSIGVGGVESRPVVIDTQKFLGRAANEIASDVAKHASASVTPMQDHSAGAEYRIALTETLVERAFNQALADAGSRGDRLQ